MTPQVHQFRTSTTDAIYAWTDARPARTIDAVDDRRHGVTGLAGRAVALTAGLCLDWGLMLAAGALLGWHGWYGQILAVLLVIAGVVVEIAALGWLLVAYDGGAMWAFGAGWCLAGLLGFACILVASQAYQSYAGRPAQAIVTDLRCADSYHGACTAEDVRVSNASNERDIGWYAACFPHSPGDQVEMLGDSNGWFKPMLAECADSGRGTAVFVEVCAGYVLVLTLAQAIVLGATARRVRKDEASPVDSPL